MIVLKTVYRLNRRGNVIKKERDTDGAWTYSVLSPEGALIAKLRFEPDRGGVERLTNGDLLEIVRDRLRAYNVSQYAATSHRTQNAEDRVTEALVWVEHSALHKPLDERIREAAAEEEE